MRIALSLLNFRPGRVGGAETYIRELARHLPLVAQGRHEITLLTYRDIAGNVESPGAAEITAERSLAQVTRARLLEAFTPYRARWAEQLVRDSRADVVLFPQQSLFPKRCPVPCVLTVHDLQHLALPANFSLTDRAFRAAIYGHSVRQASRVIAISRFTANDLNLHHAGIAEKTTVVHHGFTPPQLQPGDDTSLPLPEKYWYYPAATYPHKGHLTLLRTWTELRRQGEPAQLVFSGQQTAHWSKIRAEIDRLKLNGVVHHLGFLRGPQLASVYHRCIGVLLPTEFEGFGLPALEAAAWNKPVIVSRLPVFDEIGIPQRWQIDFHDVAAVQQALRQPGPTQLLHPPSTWTDCARATLAMLEQAVPQHRNPT